MERAQQYTAAWSGNSSRRRKAGPHGPRALPCRSGCKNSRASQKWQRLTAKSSGSHLLEKAANLGADQATFYRNEISGAIRSDVCRVRASYEDAIGLFTPPQHVLAATRGPLLIAADGMGRHAAGEIASATAIEAAKRAYFTSRRQIPASLAIAFDAANRAIFEYGEKHPECQGMGTTCTALAIRECKAWLAHVGDSRAYFLRKGQLRRLTKDQTLLAQMIRDGVISEDDAKSAGDRNFLLQALGTGPHAGPPIMNKPISLLVGDILVFCTDGLWNMVDDARLRGWLLKPRRRKLAKISSMRRWTRADLIVSHTVSG